MPKPVWTFSAVVICAALHAQTIATSFEAAVIKPSLPNAQALPLLMAGKLKAGVNIDKARVDMGFVTLTDLIVAAYRRAGLASDGAV